MIFILQRNIEQWDKIDMFLMVFIVLHIFFKYLIFFIKTSYITNITNLILIHTCLISCQCQTKIFPSPIGPQSFHSISLKFFFYSYSSPIIW